MSDTDANTPGNVAGLDGGDVRSFAETFADITALVERGPEPWMEQAIRDVADQHSTAYEDSVRGQVGIHLRQTVNVRIRKPRWMPERIYRRLMRTIVVEEGPLDVRQR